MLYRSFHVEHRDSIFLCVAKLAYQATNRGVLPAQSATTCAKQAGHSQHTNSIWPACPILLQYLHKWAFQVQNRRALLIFYFFENLFTGHTTQRGALLLSKAEGHAQIRVGIVINCSDPIATPGK